MDDLLIMLPGPTNVAPRVLRAMSKPVVNHRGDEFGEVLTETSELMSKMFKTENQSLILSGSGTAAMEAAIANTVNPGEKIINVTGGKFGERLRDISKAHGINSIEIDVEWGDVVDPKKIAETLDANEDVKAVTVIHNETSTGTHSPLKEIGKVMKNYDALLIVDTVSSLGGDYVDVDKYGIDVCFTGSQKCLAAPPGLAAITLNDEAWKATENVDSHTYYLNLPKCREKASSVPPQTPYTPAVSSVYGLLEALKIIEEEGLDNCVERHIKAAKASRNAAKALGLELFPKNEEIASNTVTSIKMPEGFTDQQVRGTMKNKYHVEVAGGQDHLKGNVFRVGHLGNISYKELAITYTALGMTLKQIGMDVDESAGVAAIAKEYL